MGNVNNAGLNNHRSNGDIFTGLRYDRMCHGDADRRSYFSEHNNSYPRVAERPVDTGWLGNFELPSCMNRTDSGTSHYFSDFEAGGAENVNRDCSNTL